MAFISGVQRKTDQILRGTDAILGNRKYKKTKFEGTKEKANLFHLSDRLVKPEIKHTTPGLQGEEYSGTFVLMNLRPYCIN